MIYAVSLAEFGAVTLQTLQETKMISLFAPKHRAAIRRSWQGIIRCLLLIPPDRVQSGGCPASCVDSKYEP
jgi:hypothetical protein